MAKKHTLESIARILEQRSIRIPECGCQIWLGGCDQKGYGFINDANGKQIRTHRMAWILRYGSIPENMQILHTCDVPPCINTNHLFIGNNDANVADKMRKGRHRVCHGEEHPLCKLTAAKVIAIRQDKRGPQAIATEHGVSRRLIYHIKFGKAWPHV